MNRILLLFFLSFTHITYLTKSPRVPYLPRIWFPPKHGLVRVQTLISAVQFLSPEFAPRKSIANPQDHILLVRCVSGFRLRLHLGSRRKGQLVFEQISLVIPRPLDPLFSSRNTCRPCLSTTNHRILIRSSSRIAWLQTGKLGAAFWIPSMLWKQSMSDRCFKTHVVGHDRVSLSDHLV